MGKARIPKTISSYLAAIGAKGGAAGKGKKVNATQARRAANIRWEKYRAEQAKKAKLAEKVAA